MAQLVESGAEIERASGGQAIPRHHHETAYAALVLKGGYVEAGDRGRFAASAGDVLFHAPFEGHADTICSVGAHILNVPLGRSSGFAFGKCHDPDGVAGLAQRDIRAAADVLLQTSVSAAAPEPDWPDLLARLLARDDGLGLAAWAQANGLRASSVSRGFRMCYGVSPKRYRLECRAAEVARAIRGGARLAEASFQAGFCDQQHMTRSVRSVFGCAPKNLRQ